MRIGCPRCRYSYQEELSQVHQTIPGFEGTRIGPDDDGYDAHRTVQRPAIERTARFM